MLKIVEKTIIIWICHRLQEECRREGQMEDDAEFHLEIPILWNLEIPVLWNLELPVLRYLELPVLSKAPGIVSFSTMQIFEGLQNRLMRPHGFFTIVSPHLLLYQLGLNSWQGEEHD